MKRMLSQKRQPSVTLHLKFLEERGQELMSRKKYKLTFLPLFENDLDDITGYITNHLQNPDAALRLIDDIEIAINKRSEAPLAFATYQSAKERPHPYYRINVRNFSIFYVVVGDTMEVRRVLYSKRNIDSLLT